MSNRLYVGNLSFNTDPETLQDAFSRCGNVREVRIMTDRETGRPRGFAFVSMEDAQGARVAIAEMNGAVLDGRALRVNEAEERPQRSYGGDAGSQGRGGSRW